MRARRGGIHARELTQRRNYVLSILGLVLAATALIVLAQVVSEKSSIPAAALLTVAGLAVSTSSLPDIVLDPELVLTLVIPPLLYSAALNSSLVAIRRNVWTILSLSVALVVVTASIVGVGLALLIPGATLAAGMALGAAVAPPDPVAALAVGRRAGIPPKLITLIEGEGLLNDATALTMLTVAATAIAAQDMTFTHAGGLFVLAAVGGVIVGCAIALVIRFVQKFLGDALLLNVVSLATPFVAYVAAEEVHASGVLAVVVAALFIGHDTRHAVSGASRLQTGAMWRLIDLLLEGFVFLLIGEQLPTVIEGLAAYPLTTVVGAVAVTLAGVLLVRPLWLLGTEAAARMANRSSSRSSRLSGREVVVMSWAGTRGVITVAAVFSLPLTTESGEPFEIRNLLLFCAFVVVLVTVVAQGTTFAPLVRLLNVRADPAAESRLRNEARVGVTKAALQQLDHIADEEEIDDDGRALMRRELEERIDRYNRRLDHLDETDDDAPVISPEQQAATTVRRRLIDAQREELVRWRDCGRLPDAGMRSLEHELDHEEHSFKQHPDETDQPG
ncbi:Na+/H+ antiporter [Rhodococcus sp. 14-2470-1a]|uniref:Na+/H+ antiporter n=1 Tax=Rhodococcus sp. 14-2470-1a TaxID=2023150 RepID=UPI000B9AB44A|nr:Na+/H+ antiporter [Rhodococcus sp. 14-2470-1a]OZF55289.1 Na+/H+ antiporter [Rhodococcus sp. 14-2470-1a]